MVATSILVGALVAGTTVAVVGQLKAGNAAKAAGEAQGQAFDYNAQIAELQAEDAETRGMDEASRFGAQVRALVGSQRASFAGQGVDVGSGSAADVQADAAYLGELDKRQILSNAQREAWGYRVDAENNRRNADIARKGGAAAQSASRWGAASTALGATSSFLIQKYGWERTPAPRRA